MAFEQKGPAVHETTPLTRPNVEASPSRFNALHGLVSYVALFTITIIGAVLRWHHAGKRQFWGDEVHTFQVANEPASLAELWHMAWNAKIMADPPLYYILSFFTAHGANDFSELRLRMLSLLFGVLAIPLFYFLVKRLASRSTALAATLLLSVSTFAIQYAQEHRPYSVLLFLTIFFLHCIVLIISGFTWLRWGLLLTSSILLIYTHYFGGFLLVAGYLLWIVTLLFGPRRDMSRRTWLGVLLLPVASAILYLPVLVHIPEMASSHTVVIGGDKGPREQALREYLAQKRPLPRYLPDQLAPFISWRLGAPEPWATWLFALTGIAGCIVLLVKNTRLFLAAAFVFVIGFILSVGFYEVLKFPFDPRRAIYLLPIVLFVVAYGAVFPWHIARTYSRSQALRAAGAIVSFFVISGLTYAAALHYKGYSSVGWRNENNQADWRGMASFVNQLAATDDAVVVPVVENDTWMRLHYSYYHEQSTRKLPILSLGSIEEMENLRTKGRALWVIAPVVWTIPGPMFEYLVSQGQWISFFGGPLFYLSPQRPSPLSDHYTRHLVSQEKQMAALAPYRGTLWKDIVVSAPLHAQYNTEKVPGIPLLSCEKSVLELHLSRSDKEPRETTPTLFPVLKAGEWQSAQKFTVIQPSSSMIRFPIRKGEPYLSVQHNGSVRYTFYLAEAGEYDLFVEGRHDRPGPITVRTFLSNSGEGPVFSWRRQNNKFGIVKGRFKAKAGANELTLYYNSFNRIENESVPDEDTFNTFDVTRWKLEKATHEKR